MRRYAGWSSLALLGVAAVVATAALGAKGSATTRSGTAGTAAETFTVNVDGRNSAVNESFDAYYPNVVTVHAGDTVVFHYVGVGEPHTVTLGTLATAADTAYNALTPAQQNNPPKSFLGLDAKLPQLTEGHTLNVTPSAANPCYLASGVPSTTAACPATAKPAFDGKQSYYGSGWLQAGEKFTVHLSSATPPGTYRFLCLVHREFMQGKIVVVPPSTPVASPAAQFAVGQKQLTKDEAGLAGAAKLLAAGKPPIPVTLPGPNPILVGSGGSNDPGQIDQFGPKTVHIPVGGSVTWWLAGDHSITFNSTKADNDIQTVFKNGNVQINAKAAAPVASPTPSGPPTNGTQGRPAFKVVASQSWNGKGFHNSGLFLNSMPPNIQGYKLTFTRAGTYKFICTVHDNMKGTIVVGG